MKLHFDEDLESLIGWCEDTLQPSLDILAIKVAIREKLQEVTDFEGQKGATIKTIESKEKFENLLIICERLDKVATQNNTFQLIVRNMQSQAFQYRLKIKELENRLLANELAWKQE